MGLPFSIDTQPNQATVKLQTRIVGPKLWTAETPNLYRVRITLMANAKALHSVTERFGFRTFEVRPGDGFYLNGQRILLKGANRHSFWPETGRTLSREISYDDVKLMKEMNMNSVRMSHYPPDAHFLEACDELGLYVLDELAGWHKFYDQPTGARLIGQMVRRDVNHPSILFWDNGNEGGWNRKIDDEFARWDPQKREVLHPWEKFRYTNTDHYEKFDSHTRLAHGPDIYMPTEFLHGLYDGGIGAGMWDYWEVIHKSKVGGGGFLWALVDECVKRTDQNGKLDCAGNRGPDGIVGPHREREGSFNTVREIWSPVQVMGPESLLDDFRGVLQVENRFDFLNLNVCRFEWQLARFPRPGDGKTGHAAMASAALRGPNIPSHGAGELKLNMPPVWRRADVLYLTVKDPAGRELWTWSWGVSKTAAPALREKQTDVGKVQTLNEPAEIVIKTGTVELRFRKQTGLLSEVKRNGQAISFANGPRFLAFRRNDRRYDDIAGETALVGLSARDEGDDVVVDASYAGALRYARWRIASNETIQLDYEYSFDGLVDVAGVRFDSPESGMKSIRWLGKGPYRVWQNRLLGTRLDVWFNKYNDSTPGESWIYPEFKGYFRDWKWAVFETAGGQFSISTEADNSFLGLYKPKDGTDGLLDFPDVGIAFLELIPAMRNKFHTTDEIGPQSKTKQVSGTVRRTVHFRFG